MANTRIGRSPLHTPKWEQYSVPYTIKKLKFSGASRQIITVGYTKQFLHMADDLAGFKHQNISPKVGDQIKTFSVLG